MQNFIFCGAGCSPYIVWRNLTFWWLIIDFWFAINIVLDFFWFSYVPYFLMHVLQAVFNVSCKTSFLRGWVLSIDRMEKPHILLAYHIFLICHKYYFPLFSIFILSLFLMHFFFPCFIYSQSNHHGVSRRTKHAVYLYPQYLNFIPTSNIFR